MKKNPPIILLVDDELGDLFLLKREFGVAVLEAKIRQAVGGQVTSDYLSASGQYAERGHGVLGELRERDGTRRPDRNHEWVQIGRAFFPSTSPSRRMILRFTRCEVKVRKGFIEKAAVAGRARDFFKTN